MHRVKVCDEPDFFWWRYDLNLMQRNEGCLLSSVMGGMAAEEPLGDA